MSREDSVEDGSDRRLISGWHGRFYENFTVGDIYKHPCGRTITGTDDVWLIDLTMNLEPMHFNETYAAGTSVIGTQSEESS